MQAAERGGSPSQPFLDYWWSMVMIYIGKRRALNLSANLICSHFGVKNQTCLNMIGRVLMTLARMGCLEKVSHRYYVVVRPIDECVDWAGCSGRCESDSSLCMFIDSCPLRWRSND